MVKLCYEEQDFLLLQSARMIALAETLEERTIAENIKQKVLDEYLTRIHNSTNRTKGLTDHLEYLKNNIK
tara:strand:+ start:459 stop:668 length:210 start_codon:yes stop_codon:yes gene_type:complete